MKHTHWYGLVLLLISLLGCAELEQLGPDPSESFIKFYGGPYDQEGRDIIELLDGGFLMVGFTTSHNGGIDKDIFVVRTDASGNEIWSKHYGTPMLNEEANALVYNQVDQEIYIGGTVVNEALNTSAMILAINENGDSLWSQSYHYNQTRPGSLSDDTYETIEDILLTSDRDLIFAGNFRRTVDGVEENQDTYLFKVDTQGRPVNPSSTSKQGWGSFRIWGFEGFDELIEIQGLPNEEVAVLGNTDFGERLQDNRNILFYTTNQFGVPTNTRTLGQGQVETASAFFQNEDGTYILVGQVAGDSGIANGQVLWQEVDVNLAPMNEVEPIRLSMDNLSHVGGVALTKDPSEESYWILGSARNAQSNSNDFFIVKTNENGQIDESSLQVFGERGDAIGGKIIPSLRSELLIIGTVTFASNRMISFIKTAKNES
ncbi:MAG: hypothetical protein AAF824_06480 [Bacteroidota bacterium]